jgi:hypothetical protein
MMTPMVSNPKNVAPENELMAKAYPSVVHGRNKKPRQGIKKF